MTMIPTNRSHPAKVSTRILKNDFEIVGRKMKPKFEGESGPEKLDVLRRAMGQDERVRISNNDTEEDDNDDLLSSDEDCETIFSVIIST